LGIVLFCLGFLDQTLAQNNAAIAEAEGLAHLPSVVVSLTFGAMLLSLIGGNGARDEQVDDLVAVAAEQGFPQWHTFGTIYRGWVKAKNGNVAEGISLLRGGSAAFRAPRADARGATQRDGWDRGAELLTDLFMADRGQAVERRRRLRPRS
jgi:hypothetical protein